MTKVEQKNIIKSIRAYRKEIVSNKQSARRFMEELGVINKNGKLTDNYK
jgi:hypothetical protein